MKKVEQSFHRLILLEIVYSVIYIIVGFILFLKSEMAIFTVGILIGTFLVMAGILNIFTFIEKSKIRLFHYNFIFGILNIMLGVITMLNPFSTLNVLNIALGIGLIIESIHKIIYFLYLRKGKEPYCIIIVTTGILYLFLGITIIINPFRNIFITKALGVFIILYNILNLNDLVLLKRRSEKVLKLFEE